MSDNTQIQQNDVRGRLRDRYDGLWSAAVGKIRAGQIEIDPLLAARQPDRRRCFTAIARPTPVVRESVAAFLEGLRCIEPDQYYYAPTEFHVTVLSLFTATVAFEPFFARKDQFVAAVDAAFTNATPIRIEFAGVTASPGAIMVQGFFDDEALNAIRDSLRRELCDRGLAETIDSRYRLETAHMTVARFRVRLRDSKRLAAALEHARSLLFGVADIRYFDLVQNDWYMTDQSINPVKRYFIY